MPARRFGRARARRPVGLKTIIICEGASEFVYFEAIRKQRHVSRYLLNVVNPGASDPYSLV
jgi:hypothetical protein